MRSFLIPLLLIALATGVAGAADVPDPSQAAAQQYSKDFEKHFGPHYPDNDEELRADLHSSDRGYRVQAVIETRNLPDGGRQFLPDIVQLLEDTDEMVRMRALYALTQMTSFDPQFVGKVGALLDDPSTAVRADAAGAIKKYGLPAAIYAPRLIALIHDADDNVAQAAAIAARHLDPAALFATLDSEVKRLSAGGPEQRAAAAHALGAIGAIPAPPEPQDAAAAMDRDPLTRFGAKLYWFMGNGGGNDAQQRPAFSLAPASARAVTALTGALNDPDPDVQAAAIAALQKYGGNGRMALAALRRETSADSEHQYAAAQAINSIEQGSGELSPYEGTRGIGGFGGREQNEDSVLAEINRNLEPKDMARVPLPAGGEDRAVTELKFGSMRGSAMAASLQYRTFDSPRIMDALLGTLVPPNGPDINVLGALAVHVKQSDKVIPGLANCLEPLNAKNDYGLHGVIFWLIICAENGPEYRQQVLDAVEKSKADDIGKGLIRGALATDAQSAVPPLIAALKADSFWIEVDAEYYLSRWGTQANAATPELLERLQSRYIENRAYAANALAHVNPQALAAHVDELARLLPMCDPREARLTAWALGRIGPAASAAVPALRNALYDEDADLRLAAAVALQRIGAPAS